LRYEKLFLSAIDEWVNWEKSIIYLPILFVLIQKEWGKKKIKAVSIAAHPAALAGRSLASAQPRRHPRPHEP